MCIVNLTPDSFSDGGRLSHKEALIQALEKHRSEKKTIIDIGAESTAPFNASVGFLEEKKRLQLFYQVYEQLEWLQHQPLSLDTYRYESFLPFYRYLRARGHRGAIFWNDVSGKRDESVDAFFELNDPDLFYVFSHNLCAARSLTGEHMNFCLDSSWDIVAHLQDYFKKAYDFFKEKEVENQVYFDPGLGFSKTKEQNLTLLKNLKKLCDVLPPEQKWLLGVSRKSFTQSDTTRSSGEKFLRADYQQAFWALHWQKEMPHNHLTLRLHAPEILEELNYFQKINHG